LQKLRYKHRNSNSLMKSQYRHHLFLLLAISAISVFTWMTYTSCKRLDNATDRVEHTHITINNISTISTTVAELQSDFRGWLIGDKTNSAREISKNISVLQQQLKYTKQLTAGNAVQQAAIDKIKILTNELIDWQRSFSQTHGSGKTGYVTPGIRDRILIDSIKQELAVMSGNEQQILIRRIQNNKIESKNRLFISIMGGFCYIVFALVVVLQLKKNEARRKVNELSVLESETKYRRLIEDAGVVMFTTNLKGDFTFVNHRIEFLTGYKNTEVVNKSFSFLVEPSHLPKLIDHYTKQFVNRLEEACIEFPVITKSGDEKWLEQDSVLIYENNDIIGFQCVVKDIHLKKMAEAALHKVELERKEYEFRLQSILDNTPLMIFIKDLEGKYILVNKRFKEAFGNGESLIGKTDYHIDTKENADKYKEADEKVIQTRQPMELEETINNNGNVQNLMVVKFPLLDQSGNIFAISGIATDITERVQYHMHLLETSKDAENAEKLQGEFLANMSHEIRTPMNGIVGMTNLLLQTPLDSEQERFLHIVRQSSENLLFLINDILDLSKIKAGKMTIESIEFNITNVIETVIAPFRIKMKEKGVELITDIHPNIPEMLIGDPYRLSQVLSNLFSNAIKFTHKGYVKFIVSITSGNDNCTLEFSIEDTGIGIAEDKISYIFESFAQATVDTTRKFGGTGLGLSITKQLIQLQNSTIEVSSIVDKGTTFRFTIPYKNVRAEVLQKAEEKQVIDKEALRGKKILIVEDNEINQMVISFTLKQAGILTTITNNGREAVELLEAQADTNFDLIIMDLQMPEMDGFQASAYIRKNLMLQTPIIAMTASVLRDERIKCFEAGMNDYMSKPFKPAELFITISKFLNDNLKKALASPSNRKPLISISPYNFNNLYKMMPKLQASEVLGMFVENTPLLLNKIQTALLLELWDEVIINARALKSSIELLQLHEMMQDIIDIERMARLNIQLEMIPSILNRLIENFNTIKPLLEEEKIQMAIL